MPPDVGDCGHQLPHLVPLAGPRLLHTLRRLPGPVPVSGGQEADELLHAGLHLPALLLAHPDQVLHQPRGVGSQFVPVVLQPGLEYLELGPVPEVLNTPVLDLVDGAPQPRVGHLQHQVNLAVSLLLQPVALPDSLVLEAAVLPACLEDVGVEVGAQPVGASGLGLLCHPAE